MAPQKSVTEVPRSILPRLTWNGSSTRTSLSASHSTPLSTGQRQKQQRTQIRKTWPWQPQTPLLSAHCSAAFSTSSPDTSISPSIARRFPRSAINATNSQTTKPLSNPVRYNGVYVATFQPARRAFHASTPRQRDHHFDTLKFVQRLKNEGFSEEQAVAMMRVLNDVIQESIQNLTRTMVLREDTERSTYTQKVDFAKLRSELLNTDSTEAQLTRSSHEKIAADLAKLNSRLRDEIGRTQASVRLDLNLEKGRIREEANSQEMRIKETETRIEQEVAGLRERVEAVKFSTLQWLMGVCTGTAALILGAWRLLIDTPHTTPTSGKIATPGWILLLLASGVSATWTWVYVKSCLRRSGFRLGFNHESYRDIPLARLEKGKIPWVWYYKEVKRAQNREEASLVVIMLLIFGSVIWLCFHLISPSFAALDVFQVYQPVSVPGSEPSSCNGDILLLDHVFGYSYGHPYVGYYEPPNCEFDTVRMNLTVTSKGRQYDRLATMFLGDTEVFRTSTAEPTADGIIWTYIKDMSQYNALWKKHQKLIFDLGNLITEIYTGSFNVTLTAHFSYENNVKTPDIILPISAQKSTSNSSSVFNVPSDNATVLQKVDPETSRAVVSISACGQSTEEFWWSNVFSSDMYAFDSTIGELYGHSPFREVQLYIDGILAGVVWPFPIIFTGGVAPGFWRPIVGIDAFDLREPEIDISPFLPLLTDGEYHSFELKVIGLDVSEDGVAMLSDTVGSYWIITGNIYLYLDNTKENTSRSDNRKPQVVAPEPTFTTTRHLVQNQTGANETLAYSVTAERILTIRSSEFSWSQNLSYSNFGLFNQLGLSQRNDQHTSGRALISQLEGGGSSEELSFEYPLFVNQTYANLDTELTIDAWMRTGLEIDSTGMPGVSTYSLTHGPLRLHTEQWGQAHYRAGTGNKNSTSFGDTSDVFESNAGGKAYWRAVRAVNGSVVSDTEDFQ
ncbi:hypothetical protein AOCH_002220 [Aspergillus ochraceoroseus]|uniref:Peptide N-acetyl-beta-D-glucosaminyl asparaginase amidase A N-terminal domain-containing protein n=2 Tax=Aspergillus ochraceoroseus TaxID=138278 RepID=A0A0F8XML0_9EURO|nr:hypothetical protein AOCH_002220 [Aspergillus ochraceoroseus]